MGDKDLRARAAEVHRLAIGCERCKSEIVFEAAATRGPAEVYCQNCGTLMPNASKLVTAYRTFFAGLDDAQSVHFVIRLDD